METEPPESCVLAEEQDGADSAAWCLRRVGRNTDWLHLPEDEEVGAAKSPPNFNLLTFIILFICLSQIDVCEIQLACTIHFHTRLQLQGT